MRFARRKSGSASGSTARAFRSVSSNAGRAWAVEVLLRPLGRASGRGGPAPVPGDQEVVEGAEGEGLVQLERPEGERPHQALVGCQLRVPLRKSDGRPPCGGRPVDERDILLAEPGDRDRGVAPEALLEVRVPDLQPAESVAQSPPVELPGAAPQLGGPGQVLPFDVVRLALHEGVGVLGEAARRRQEEPLVRGGDVEEPLDRLQAERGRDGGELGILLPRVARPAPGDRRAGRVDGGLLDGAPGEEGEEARQGQEDGAPPGRFEESTHRPRG